MACLPVPSVCNRRDGKTLGVQSKRPQTKRPKC